MSGSETVSWPVASVTPSSVTVPPMPPAITAGSSEPTTCTVSVAVAVAPALSATV